MTVSEKMKNVEILAPSGDFECLNAAIRYGADAIYIGGPFMQLRAKAASFPEENIEKAAKICHDAGKKLYVTTNSFAKNEEIDELGVYARTLKSLGVDAAIVSDLGAISAMREGCPELEIHVSTQANCQNYKAAEVYQKMGATRVVVAREMSLEAIGEMHSRLPSLEIEAFVHGAMCMSYSGRCMMSTFMTGRSGNRGECAQPCRWTYNLVEQRRPNEYYPVEQYEDGLAILSSGDLNCMSFVDEIVDAGVCSLKIEGRMKSPFYVASVANAYSMRKNGLASVEALEREVHSVSHRPYIDGFYYGQPAMRKPDKGDYVRECSFVGLALEDAKDGKLVIEQRNVFKIGDVMEVLRPNHVGEEFVVTSIVDSKGEVIERANKPKTVYTINCDFDLKKGDMLRVRV